MRIGLISDTHGDPVAWDAAMRAIGEVDLITHAGDVLYHGIFNPITGTYRPRHLAEILNGWPVPMVHARGNCDSEVDQLALENHILSDFAFVSHEGVRILVTHGHKYPEEDLVVMARRARADILHVGHTHVPVIKTVDDVVVFNAGSCAVPKHEGEFGTVGMLEDGKLYVLDVRSGERYLEGVLPG